MSARVLALFVTFLLLPVAQASAQSPVNIGLLGVNKAFDHQVAVTLRCNVPEPAACRAKIAVRLAADAADLRRGALLAQRTLLVPAGGPRVVWLRGVDEDAVAAIRDGKFGVRVQGWVGSRRIATVVRSRLNRIRIPGGLPRFAGGAPDARRVVGSVQSGGCGSVFSLAQVAEDDSGVEIAFAADARELPADSVCSADFRIECIAVTLAAPLGERAVWQRVGGVLQAFALPAPETQQGAVGRCPELAPGGSVVA